MTDPCGHSNSTHPSGCWYIAVVEAVAAERARIRAAVAGRMVTRTRPAEHEWSRGFRDGWNDAIGTVLRIIEGETHD
jgi:hypothetical protein